MAVVVVGGEGREGRSGNRWNGKQIETFHTYHYLIDAGSKTETRENVLYSGALPFAGITSRVDGSVCSFVDAVRDSKNPRYWHATVEYSTQSQDQDAGPSGISANPVTWVPRWKMDHSIHEWTRMVDGDGTPISNSAGQAFDQGMPDVHTVVSFVFSQYESDNVTEAQLSDRNGAVNIANFKGFQKYTLLLNITGSERGIYNGFPLRRVDYRIDFKVGIPQGTFRVFEGGNWVRSTYTSGWLETRYDVGEYWWDGADKRVDTTAEGARTHAKLNGQGGLVLNDGPPALLAFKPRMKSFASFLRI